ncbi:MAG TPA: hypothetical protein VFB32_09465 [Rudaea sp.]|nr:hypothetical protein [Rudaea sp.]
MNFRTHGLELLLRLRFLRGVLWIVAGRTDGGSVIRADGDENGEYQHELPLALRPSDVLFFAWPKKNTQKTEGRAKALAFQWAAVAGGIRIVN